MENLVDFEDQRQLFGKMLEDPREKRLMFIQAPGGRGKTSLLRMLSLHCEGKDIPYCSIDSGDQPYDNAHFTLSLAICNQLGVSPRHLADVLQPLTVDGTRRKTVSQILAGVSVTHPSLRERHIRDLLKNAFLADLRQLVKQKGRLVCFFDSFESISAEEEDWLLDTLLWQVATGVLKGVTIVTAGDRWPRINEWEWKNHTYLVNGLPKMKPEHIKLYAEKLNIKMTDDEANFAWKFSASGTPLHVALMVRNLL